MNGLQVLILLMAGAFVGYCTAALLWTSGEADRRAEVHEIRRRADKWDGTR